MWWTIYIPMLRWVNLQNVGVMNVVLDKHKYECLFVCRYLTKPLSMLTRDEFWMCIFAPRWRFSLRVPPLLLLLLFIFIAPWLQWNGRSWWSRYHPKWAKRWYLIWNTWSIKVVHLGIDSTSHRIKGLQLARCSVTRLGDFLHFGQLFKALGNN